MGNCCGKQSSDSDAFSQPGRVLGSNASGPNATTPLNQNKKKNVSSVPPPKVGGPPRTLGGGGSSNSNKAGERSSSTSDVDEARRKAAEAAEARAKASSGKGGKLQSQLAAQRKQTRNDTLKDASEQALRSREAEEAAQARNWE